MPDMSAIQPPYLDPSQYPAYLDLQRKQMLAQALMQGSQQMNQTPADWNSMRIVPKRSLLSAIAPVIAAGLGGKMQRDLMGSQANYFQRLMGGNTPPQTVAPAPSAPSSAPSGQQGSSPAPLTAQMPPQSGLQAPQDSGVSPIPPGMTPGRAQQLAMIAQANPEYFKAVIAPQLAPTEIEKLGRLAGMTSAEIQAAGRAAVAKETNIPLVAGRKGAPMFDHNGNVVAFSPDVPEGAQPVYGADGKTVTAIQPIPGAEAAAAAAAAGKTAGTVSQTPLKVGVDASGRDVYEFPKPPALAAEGAASGTGRQAPKVGQPTSGGVPASKAVLSAQEEGGKTGQQYANELAKNATGATEVRRGLSELSNLAQLATPNAANTRRAQVGALLVAAGVSSKTASSIVGADIGAIDAAAHQSGSLAVGSIHSMTSRGTNFDLDTFMKQNPNLDMGSPEGFSRVVQYMDSKAKQEIAKNADFVDWKRTHKMNPEDWESEHTAHWLEQQNQQIDQRRFNSRPPLSSFVRP